MEQLINFINDLSEFVNSGIYDFITETLSQLVIYLSISAIQLKIYFVTISWGVAQEIINSFNISSLVSQAWSGIPSPIFDTLNFFRIPDALNVVLNASVTKYAMRFLGL